VGYFAAGAAFLLACRHYLANFYDVFLIAGEANALLLVMEGKRGSGMVVVLF
jgi:hypothetical protein